MDNKLKVTMIKNGPLMVEGKVKVENPSGEILKEAEKVFLCRCGQSKNKPFCDASHKAAGFEG